MQPPTLKRNLSLTLLTLYGLGTTIGAGIYVLTGKVAGVAGVFSPVSFFVAALLAGLTALTFADLSARYPLSAGEAVYVERAFGRPALSLAIGLMVVFVGLTSSAAIVTGVVGYLQNLVAMPGWLVIVLIVGMLAAVAIWGIAQSVSIAAVATILEIAGLALIIWAGSGALTLSGLEAAMAAAPGWGTIGWHGVVAGAILAFYAFIGFEDMVNVAEEVRDAPRVMPRAIVLTLLLTALLYVLISLVSVAALPIERLAESAAPLSDVFASLTGLSTVVIDAIAAVAVVNGALIQIIMASRVLYGLARQNWLPAAFAGVNRRTRTPVVATLAAAGIVLALALTLPLVLLAKATSVMTLIIFALVNAALIRTRLRNDPESPGFRVPLWVPVAGCVSSVGFAAFQVMEFLTGRAI